MNNPNAIKALIDAQKPLRELTARLQKPLRDLVAYTSFSELKEAMEAQTQALKASLRYNPTPISVSVPPLVSPVKTEKDLTDDELCTVLVVLAEELALRYGEDPSNIQAFRCCAYLHAAIEELG